MAQKLLIIFFVFVFFLFSLPLAGFAKEIPILSQTIIGGVTGSLAGTAADLTEDTVEEIKAEIYTPRLLPDSRWYFVKTIWENVRLFFTFDKVAKARYLVGLAEKRIAEAKALLEKGKSEKAERSLERYQETLGQAMNRTQEISTKDAEELKTRLNETIQRHEQILSVIWTDIKEKTKLKEKLEGAIKVLEEGLEKFD